MRTNYVLVDYESVRPESLAALAAEVIVFVGANQPKLPFGLMAAMQRLGERGEYVRISGNGRNALDFHIAFHLGRLAAVDPAGHFHVVSRDTGFDPLVAHLKARKIHAGRVADVGEIPLVRAAGARSAEQRLVLVVERLAGMNHALPRTVKTLSSTIASLFQKKISEADVAALVALLRERGHIAVSDTRVTYPQQAPAATG